MQTMILNNNEKHNPTTQRLLDSVYGLRYETFKARLDWDIETSGGKEKDYFDDLNSYHIAIARNSQTVDGCWRALPTQGDYMLEKIFPELLQGEVAPKAKNVWEISRFAVRKGSAEGVDGYWNNITVELIASFNEFAAAHGVDHYVTVTTVACERILRQLNVKIRRMGEGKEMKIGKERSVALWIDVSKDLKVTAN